MRPLALLPLTLLLAASGLGADLVVFVNGDRLSGEIVATGTRRIRLKTPYGRLEIPRIKQLPRSPHRPVIDRPGSPKHKGQGFVIVIAQHRVTDPGVVPPDAEPLWAEIIRHPAFGQHLDDGFRPWARCRTRVTNRNCKAIPGKMPQLELVGMPTDGEHLDAIQLQRFDAGRLDVLHAEHLSRDSMRVLKPGIPNVIRPLAQRAG